MTRKQAVNSSRPGRPPKRSLGVLQDNARLLPHSVSGLLSPGLITPTGITAAAMAEAMKLQKMKLMVMNTLQGNGNQNGNESEPDDLNSNTDQETEVQCGSALLIAPKLVSVRGIFQSHVWLSPKAVSVTFFLLFNIVLKQRFYSIKPFKFLKLFLYEVALINS
ncbi:dachshund homolog 2-like isoform X1 [Canis aureus]